MEETKKDVSLFKGNNKLINKINKMETTEFAIVVITIAVVLGLLWIKRYKLNSGGASNSSQNKR